MKEKSPEIAQWINHPTPILPEDKPGMSPETIDMIINLKSDAADAKAAAIFFGILFLGIVGIVCLI